MKFTANATDLGKALKLAMSACERKHTLPILSHLLVKADANGLTITASDLDREVTLSTAAAVQEQGVLAIEGAMLSDVVSRASGKEIALTSEPGKVVVSSGRSRTSIPTLEPEDFPALTMADEFAEFALVGGEFQKAAARVLHAVCTVDARAYLCGIYVHPDGNSWACVATDGARLAKVSFPAPTHGTAFTPFILPPKTAVLASKLFPNGEALTLKTTDKLIAISGATASLTSKLIDGSYPDYARVVPPKDQTVRVDRESLIAAIGRVSVAGGEIGVTFSFNGESLHLSARRGAGAEGYDEIGISQTRAFEASYHPQLILDGLGMFGDGDIEIDLSRANSPVVIHGDYDGTFAVVMPIVRPVVR